MLTAYQPEIYADATSLIVFEGAANVAVVWTLVSGPGVIEPLSTHTDSMGRAAARYRPNGLTGLATIRCSHGS